MRKKTRASTDTLEQLHDEVAKGLLAKVKSGEATAAELAVATKFLKDNDIKAVPTEGSPVDNLAKSLPVFDEDESVPGSVSH